jgi:hypothetical protein
MILERAEKAVTEFFRQASQLRGRVPSARKLSVFFCGIPLSLRLLAALPDV